MRGAALDPQFGIVLPLWSYAADAGRLLERCAGEIGLDHIVVPVITGAQSDFRLECDPEHPLFQTEGGWHFPPAAKQYAHTGLRPPKARWFGATDHLLRLREHAQRLGLRLVLRVGVCGVALLTEQAAYLRRRNAWGQELRAAGACPSHPVARDLLRATLEDLRRYEPGAFELADCGVDAAADGVPLPPGWHPAARWLLDLCFCPACRQIAERGGVDPDSAARSARVLAGRAAERARALEPDDVLRAYVAARLSDTRVWLSSVASADSARRWDLVHPPDGWPLDLRATPLGDMVRLGSARTDIDAWPRVGIGSTGISFAVWGPAFAEAAALVRLVGDAVARGIRTLDFEDLDEAPPEAVTWVKQAVRFARRR
jgi:hypothetical protein